MTRLTALPPNPAHTSPFRVHVFDVDPWNELRTHVVLRFCQQAASDASAAAGFDVEWYEAEGALWVVRRTLVEYLAPAYYRDRLEVRTWVADLRRVRSQREYELWRPADETLIARATTDWVYVDARRGTPARPPEIMQRLLMPGAVARPRPPRAAAVPPETAAHIPRRVELADVDSVGHVNNAAYAVYVEQAVWDALAAHGWRLDPLQPAVRPRVVAHDLEYFDEAAYGDSLLALVWVSACSPDGFTTQCTILRDTTRLLHASTDWRWDAQTFAAAGAAVRALAADPAPGAGT